MARYEFQTLECPDVPGRPKSKWWDFVKDTAWQKLRWSESCEKTILQQVYQKYFKVTLGLLSQMLVFHVWMKGFRRGLVCWTMFPPAG
jgi:hypothetical protein